MAKDCFPSILGRTGGPEIGRSLALRRDDDQQAAAGTEKAFKSGELSDSHRSRHRLRGGAKEESVEGTTEERAISSL